jgi:hypothetical protein
MLDDGQFVILKFMGKTPTMATCARCHLKFFAPLELIGSPNEAEENMRDKFLAHACRNNPLAELMPKKKRTA